MPINPDVIKALKAAKADFLAAMKNPAVSVKEKTAKRSAYVKAARKLRPRL